MLEQSSKRNSQAGFTLVEIIVSTAIFVLVVSAMLVLFNSTLSINRRVQSLRQVAQGTRNFTEMVAREIRNGRIDYNSANSHCDVNNYKDSHNQSLAIINKDGERLCFYLNLSDNSLYVSKVSGSGSITQGINPPNFDINPDSFRFIINPVTDPVQPGLNGSPGIQPYVTILSEFNFQIAPGQPKVVIPYQTTVSTDVYDIPPFSSGSIN